MTILVLNPVPEDFDKRVAAISPAATTVHANSDDAGYAEALPQAEILLGRPKVDDMARAEALRWLQLTSAGANTYAGRIPEHILLTSANGVYGVSVAEHAFALMLGVARCLPHRVRSQTNHDWNPAGDVLELCGGTLGILGIGDIGREIAARARAFGMRVVATRRNPEKGVDGVDEMFGSDRLAEMLGQCDYVVNVLPATRETDGLIDGELLCEMKPGAVFVNVGRGSTVDESALIRALEDGHLAGAGLDVFEEEPLPEESPLWRMPNVLLTPHVGGASPRIEERTADLFLENLQRYVEGERLRNVVDHAVGY